MNRKRHLLGILLLGFMTITSICTSGLLCEPVVLSTNIDYLGEEYNLPYGEVHAEFAENYSGNDLSVSLRNDVVKKMEHKADSLGENPEVLYECVKATYEDWNTRPMRIPCYAEKCLYDSQPVWAIAFNRANSFEEETPGHFDVYFVSCAGYEILYYDGCF